MSFIQDILPIFKKYSLTLVEKKQEVNDIFTFLFEPQEKMQYKSGQHGIFFVKHRKIKKSSRPISIASTHKEGKIMISMKISENPSEFKQALRDMEQGESMVMRGPVGSFYFKNQNPVLLIAGGIGITPFRALIKDSMEAQGSPESIKLLYADTHGDFIYREEFDEMSQRDTLDVEYINNRDQLMEEIKEYTKKHGNEATYFVTGSSGMVKSIKKELKGMGIKNKNIKADAFIGY